MNAMVMTDKGIPIIETWDAMTKRHFNEKVSVLKYMAAGGLTCIQAGTVLDRSSGYIRKFIANNGLDIKFKRANPHHSEARAAAMAKTLADRIALSQREPRLTCKQAAKKQGVSYSCLRTYSHRHNIPWKPVGATA